jgi:putative solute:sodium symporter small subunit
VKTPPGREPGPGNRALAPSRAAKRSAPASGNTRASHDNSGVRPDLAKRQGTAMQVSENHQSYWRKNLRITAILLLIWFVVTYVVGFFARDLNFDFFGWPFSFWVGAQGALVVYVLIIGFYAWYMNKLDIEHGVAEEE